MLEIGKIDPMKICELTIKNVKSFKETTTIKLNDDFTLFVGPNAGGKSNFLDILLIVLRNYFIWSYQIVEHSDNQRSFNTIQRYDPFNPISKYLDKFIEDASEQQIYRVL